MATALKTASVLAFERKLDPSDALFFAGNWSDKDRPDNWKPVGVREKSVRGTISNRLKAKDQDPLKLNAEINKPNLQRIDTASLDPDNDTLKVQFSLRVLPGVGIPSACNNSDYQAKLMNTVNAFVEKNGFGELASRYVYNLASGRFLWRNRIGAEKVVVKIEHIANSAAVKTWQFDSLELSLRNFYASGDAKSSLAELTEAFSKALQVDSMLLHVTAFAQIGRGQEVFPSQELILDSGRGRGEKSKTLYHVNGIAAMHSQKVGNAIRTIDTWYPGADEIGPIAIEPYGSVTTLGKAYRQPKEKMDFYTLLDNWIVGDKAPAVDQQNYVMAILIRGGVFGEKEKESE